MNLKRINLFNKSKLFDLDAKWSLTRVECTTTALIDCNISRNLLSFQNPVPLP